jgi:hypothetical protein
MLARLRTALLRRVLSSMKEVHDVSGFRVIVDNKGEGVETAALLSRLGISLGWIERYQPWRLRNMRRDITQILIGPWPRRGAFLTDTGTCVLDLAFLAGRESSPVSVAATLIHEGMHARIHRRGIVYDGPTKGRQERICIRAQLEFGQSLPDELGAGVMQRARDHLGSEDGDISRGVSWTEMRRKYLDNA